MAATPGDDDVANNRMWLTYRPTGGRILLARSPDGVHWEPREKCHTLMDGRIAGLAEALEVLFEHARDDDRAYDPTAFSLEFEKGG